MVPTLSVLPARLAMPPGPPRSRAVYCVEAVSAVDGVRVAVRVSAEYVTAAGTSVFDASRSSKVVDMIVAWLTGPLNVAVMLPLTSAPEAPGAGSVVVTVGGDCEAALMLQLLTTPTIGSPNTALVHAVPSNKVL